MVDPLQIPALKTPPGVTSQFPTTYSSEQAWFYVAATLSAVVPGTLLLLRLYTKIRIVRNVDLIDYLAILSFLFLIVLIIVARLGFAQGAGVHQWNLPMHNLITLQYWLYIAQILYSPTHFLAKTAILLQYLRLFAPQKSVDPFMWYSARIVIAVAGIFYCISAFMTIFACSPREAIWNTLITDYKCVDNVTLILITCLFNIVSDIIILTLPAKAVWKLRIPIQKKVKIVLLFAIGLIACLATVMILFYLYRMSGSNPDESYNSAWLGLWAFAEISVGVSVTGTFFLPKLLEAEGPKLRGGLGRAFTSLTRSSGRQRRIPTASSRQEDEEEVALDTVTVMMGRDSSSRSDTITSSSLFHDHREEEDVER